MPSISAITRPSTSSTRSSRINGVGQATLFGPLDYSLRVWLDPDRLTELNLTPNDVITAVQGQNVQAALGRVGAAPITNEQQFQLTIKTKGRLTRPEEFANIVLRANPDGSVVRIKDVARVEMGARSQDRYSRFNGAPAAAHRHLPVAGRQRRRRDAPASARP